VPGGHRGCASSFLTVRSLLMAAAQGMGRFPVCQEILRLAMDGDPACSQAVRQAAWALGVVIANVTNTTMVKRVILAGEGAAVAQIAPADLERGIATRRTSLGAITLGRLWRRRPARHRNRPPTTPFWAGSAPRREQSAYYARHPASRRWWSGPQGRHTPQEMVP
jgi:predicted NBD/HSP70 family sugar kinase